MYTGIKQLEAYETWVSLRVPKFSWIERMINKEVPEGMNKDEESIEHKIEKGRIVLAR